MRSVNIAELKNSLSAYLRLVRAGEELVIRNRNRAIARIVPIEAAGDEEEKEEERDLVAAGLLRLGTGPIEDLFWDLPAPRISSERVQQALQEDRDAW